jgi:sugar phosphate isomerase/epimerase
LNLCLKTDSLAAYSFEETLDIIASLGLDSVEIATGGQSEAPHMKIDELLGDASKRAYFENAITVRGLDLAALNCSAWPMHPVRGADDLELIRKTIRLANELDVDKIVTMSGCPGDSAEARTINWIWFAWPPEMLEIREQQWQTAFETWHDLAEFALNNGVKQLALELHPLQLVYNVPTLLRLRDEVGPVIGANVDPSHLFWQQVDPVRVVTTLGDAVHHVHLKDAELFEDQLAITGVLDPRDWDDPENRSWIFRTIGHGHGAAFWGDFINALREIGYSGALCIENEDPVLPGKDGVSEAVRFVKELLDQ